VNAKPTTYAWFSRKQSESYPGDYRGTWYMTPDGRQVLTTEVTSDPFFRPKWPDAQFVGEVTRPTDNQPRG
jgi:hypothetical protein